MIGIRRSVHSSLIVALGLLFWACNTDTESKPTATPKSAETTVYHITADDLPEPYATETAGNGPIVVPTVNGAQLHAPSGFEVDVWADGFERPRQAYVAPNGDVLIVESGGGRVTLLRDADGDGTPELRSPLLEGLRQPFGIDFHEGWLYIGNTNNVVRVPYRPGQERIEAEPAVVVPNLPTGGHWTRDVIFSPDGRKMYVSVGSGSNIGEESPRRAAILEFNPDGTGERIYAGGLRNPVGLRFNPRTGQLWTAVNERDGLGDDLPPDYATSVQDGGFYGWPYAYIGPHPQPELAEKRPDLVEKSIVPDVLIQAHSAPLGLIFYTGEMFPEEYRGDLFIALHGSWNRSKRTGYKIIRAHMDASGKPLGTYEDFITGWSPDPTIKEVWGRPVGFAQMPDGSLLIMEDGGNKVWRVRYSPSVTSVTPQGKLPARWAALKTLAVLPAFPNPANPEVWVPFVLAFEARVRLAIFDMRGALVRTVDMGHLAPGEYVARDRAARWDGANESGEPIARGIYFVQVRAGDVRSRLQRVVLGD